ncbi:MAG: hypothetical protein QG597_1472 [Actinomycetota bacterium]|nr:hypothetical protein [Actinomycetota bacterium]
MTDLPTAASASDPDRISQPEFDRLAHAVTERFAPHLNAAEVAVRDAEKGLTEAQEALAAAEYAAANKSYRSDPLVFMRATVSEDLDALARKSTPKKVRASFRYLLDRATELAEGELAGHRNDLEAARQERIAGVGACRQAEQVAIDELEAARAMAQRVHDAERAALDGLELLREKMGSTGG